MSLLVRDSMSGKMVEVGEGGGLSIYICGPTVYDHIHVGNARAPLFWDVVARYLRSRGYDVTFVQNITDIEDKIINRANQEGVSWQEIVDRYTDSFHERLEMLGIGMPDVEPRATEHIPEMISLIEELIEKGHAYAPEEARGDVYYAVGSFPRYGALSHQRPEEMRETEKGQTGFKRSPLDFALWKASKPGEPSWESPWGPGRPGWHIECSAMVSKHLPEGADIHGGGTDIRFPHHENELAQSTAAHPDLPFVRAWAHHGMVTLASEKMAKSVGNVLDVERAVDLHGRNAVRMWLLQSHYSQPIEFSEEVMTIFGFDLEEEIEDEVDGIRIRRSIDVDLDQDLGKKVARRTRARQERDWETADKLRDELEAAGWGVEDNAGYQRIYPIS